MLKNNHLHLLFSVIVLSLVPVVFFDDAGAKEKTIARIALTEPAGLNRTITYVQVQLYENLDLSVQNLVAVDEQAPRPIPCQVFDMRASENDETLAFKVIFPIALGANETKTVLIKAVNDKKTEISSNLEISGSGLELRIENEFYQVDMTTVPEPEPKSHHSGQIRELLIKMGFGQLLTNGEDRVHWAPNFKRPELEYYTTIAHWDSPRYFQADSGLYLIQTKRQDRAPDHPEILLTAVYKFYARLPYFRFYSSMRFVENLWLELLRNDEMTMDSMFTHVAFERPDGDIVDIDIESRHDSLAARPIEDDASWLCFYHSKKGFAFGTIRLQYDNTDEFGGQSPTYEPHTQIGQWLNRRYWNRRLIHNHLTFVPKGSRYVEDNAYLVFRIGDSNRFEEIQKWSKLLHNPVRVSIDRT